MTKKRFACKTGCSECCTIAPVYKDVWDKATSTFHPVVKVIDVEQFRGRAVVLPITTDGICALLNLEGKCSVYGGRHEVCKLFGLTNASPCPYLRANGEDRSKGEVIRIKEAWHKRQEAFFEKVNQ